MAKKKTETTPTGDRIQLSVFDVAIMGGKLLPEAEQGTLDTEDDPTSPLHDIRLQTVKMTDAWVNSFVTHGVMQDVEVVYLADGKTPFVVDGRERIRGARLASRQTGKQLGVWCRVVKLAGTDLFLRGLLANMHHADSVPTKIAKAKQAIAGGLTEDQFAPAMGVTPETIKVWMTFDKKAIDTVKAAVNKGDISAVTGFKIARLKTADQQPALDAVMAIGKKRATVTVVEDDDEDEGSDNVNRRSGSTSAEESAINTALGKRPLVAGKKGLKRLLRGVKEIKLPKNADDREVGWWAGVEDCLELLLGVHPGSEDGKRLDALAGADSTPEEVEEEPVPEPKAPKAKKAKASPETLAPPVDFFARVCASSVLPEPVEEPKKETVRQRQIREAAEAKAKK